MVFASRSSHPTVGRWPRSWAHLLILSLLIVGVEFTLPSPVRADSALPAVPPPGTRAYAMGGAYVAVVSDPSALYWNPAALGQEHVQLHASLGGQNLGQVGDLFALGRALEANDPDELTRLAGESIDIPLSALAAASFGPAAFGVGLQGVAAAEAGSTGATAEYTLVKPFRVGVGMPVLTLPALGSLRVGAAAAYYAGDHYRWADGTNPEKDSGAGFGVDLGARLGLTPWLSAGLVVHDVVNTFSWEKAELESPEPSWQVGVQATPPIAGVTLAADLDSEQLLHVGAEWRLLGLLALRGGYVYPLDEAQKPENLAPLRAGLGLGFLVGGLDVGIGLATDPVEVKDIMVGATFGF